MLYLPLRGAPKPRPRLGKGHTHNPAEYTAWKAEVVKELHAMRLTNQDIAGALSLELVFGTDGMWVQLRPIKGFERAKHVQADVDNLSGGIMDAMTDANVYGDDAQVVELHTWIDRRIT